jgi:hypothetical protein
VLVVVAAPRIFGGLRERLRRPLVLFAVVGAVASELIYLRLPWKFAHLLPLLVCVVIIIGTSKTLKPAWLIALAVAQLSWGLVAVRIVAPDVPNAATTARIDLAIVYGPLVTDVRCRVDQRLSGPLDDTSFDRAAAAYECSNRWAFDDDPTAPIGAGP